MEYLLNKKAIFLDRDGVINKEINYLHKINDFIFIDGVFDACRYFQDLGYSIFIITNQSGISRKLYKEEDYHILTKWMVNEFKNNNIDILDVFYCPHGPDSRCNCRKPKPGMLLEAQSTHNIDLSKSWLIGDREDDIKAAYFANIPNSILVRSGHQINEQNTYAKFVLNSIKDSIKIIT